MPGHEQIDWRPAATRETIKARATLLKSLRDFMAALGIIEVETPILNLTGSSDPHISNLCLTDSGIGRCYLHTSPEYAMKRLLAAGIGSIYQITKVFRGDESGKVHMPEFTMLEWYQVGDDYHDLMQTVQDLLKMLGFQYISQDSYQSVFQQYTGLDPHTVADSALQACAAMCGWQQAASRNLLLDVIFSHKISPSLGQQGAQIIYDYPACQAALASLKDSDPVVAERFEVFISGHEIANAFNELRDPDEQRQRFIQNNVQRRRDGQALVALDEQLLAALAAGLPPCAGIALGVDRLLMAMLGIDNIAKVQSIRSF